MYPDCCNLNFYENANDSVGPHSDSEQLFGSTENKISILSFSLGASRPFTLHPLKKDGQHKVLFSTPLHHGDLLVMEKLTQKYVAHAAGPMPKAKHNPHPRGDPRRVNLTFRWLHNHHTTCPKVGSPYLGWPRLPVPSATPGELASELAFWKDHRKP